MLKDDRASVLKGRSEFEKSPSHKLVHVYLQPLGQRAIFLISQLLQPTSNQPLLFTVELDP